MILCSSYSALVGTTRESERSCLHGQLSLGVSRSNRAFPGVDSPFRGHTQKRYMTSASELRLPV